jgi:hypothetical protein
MVANNWQAPCAELTPLIRWQSKIRRLRQYLRGWAKHTAGTYRKEKKNSASPFRDSRKKAEDTQLSDQEINLKHYLRERLVTLLREEELKWYE